MNIAAFLDPPAAADPGRPALIVDDEPVSYAALHEEVGRWAATLAAAGIGPGDHLALADWGGVRATAVTLAAAHLGAATAQMNPLLTSDELAQLATVAGCRPVGVAHARAAAALRNACAVAGFSQRRQGVCRQLERWCVLFTKSGSQLGGTQLRPAGSERAGTCGVRQFRARRYPLCGYDFRTIP